MQFFAEKMGRTYNGMIRQVKHERRQKEKVAFSPTITWSFLKYSGDVQSPCSTVTFSNGEITLATVSAEDYKTCHSKQPRKGGSYVTPWNLILQLEVWGANVW